MIKILVMNIFKPTIYQNTNINFSELIDTLLINVATFFNDYICIFVIICPF